MRLRNGKRIQRPFRSSYRPTTRNPIRNGNAVRSGIGVTNQHDSRSVYRRTRQPRRKRRRWRKFTNKVHAVAENELGTRTVLFNKTIVSTNTNPTNHGIADYALYSWQSSSTNLNDLDQMGTYENGSDPTANQGITISKSTKWLFKSGILDITFRNTSYVLNASLVAIPAPEAKLEVDVYDMLSSRYFQMDNTAIQSLVGALQQGALDTPPLNNIGPAISPVQRGSTPWDFPLSISSFRLKILKKTKYFVNNQDCFTYQVRDPKRHVITQNKMSSTDVGPNMPGMTRWILVIFKLLPGMTVGTASGQYGEQLTAGVTRKYMYKIEGANEDRDRYLANT